VGDWLAAQAKGEATASGTVASASFMITHAQKADLRGRGYADDEIAALTPQQAHDILV
jgi:hypothetical protein